MGREKGVGCCQPTYFEYRGRGGNSFACLVLGAGE